LRKKITAKNKREPREEVSSFFFGSKSKIKPYPCTKAFYSPISDPARRRLQPCVRGPKGYIFITVGQRPTAGSSSSTSAWKAGQFDNVLPSRQRLYTHFYRRSLTYGYENPALQAADAGLRRPSPPSYKSINSPKSHPRQKPNPGPYAQQEKHTIPRPKNRHFSDEKKNFFKKVGKNLVVWIYVCTFAQ
jgi:hypothetical protein